MAKRVELSTGRSWKTVKAAKLHFSNLLDSKPIGEAFDGLDAVDIEAAYFAYCRATAWEIAANPETFYPTYENGVGFASRCFGITYLDGSTGRFSMNKALSAIGQ